MTCGEVLSFIWSTLSSVSYLEWFKVASGAWPVWIFAGAVLFRRPVSEFIRAAGKWFENVTEVETPVGTIKRQLTKSTQVPNDPIEHPLADNPVAERKVARNPAQEGLSPAMSAIVQRIETQLQAIDQDHRTMTLVRALAFAQLNRAFESVFADIFNSQIEFLRLLREAHTITRQQASDFFETRAKVINEKILGEYGFEAWLHYLSSNGLVLVSNQTVEISDLGIDFLIFVNVTKAGFHKSF